MTFRAMISDSIAYAAFNDYAMRNLFSEDLDFYRQVLIYENNPTLPLGDGIWNRYLVLNAPKPVNVTAAAIADVTYRRAQRQPMIGMFQAARDEVEANILPRARTWTGTQEGNRWAALLNAP